VWVVLLARAVDSLEDHDHVDVEDSVVEDQLGVVALEEVVVVVLLQEDDW
jgi:hypothetical protein